MAEKFVLSITLFFFLLPLLCDSFLVQNQLVLNYHNGVLLKGNFKVNLIWYGKFSPAERSVIVDFIESLSEGSYQVQPSVSAWWKTTSKYAARGVAKGLPSKLGVGNQLVLADYSHGKLLHSADLLALASKVPATPSSVNVVLTSSDVAVDGFCMNRCGTHGISSGAPYLWVGNSEVQCPGYCAWPFHQPLYGPQTPPLVSPNGNVGVDGMVITLATLLANTVTNPFRNGYFLGPAEAPLEAVSACTGIFGTGSYPGYPGQLLSEKTTGSSFNAYGVRGRKYLLPAMWDPETSMCKTMV